MRSSRRAWLWLAIPGLWLLAVAAVEVGARLLGARPRPPVITPGQPITRPDPVLGWRLIPGHYRIGPFALGARAVDLTIGPDGARVSAAAGPTVDPTVLLLGCSFTLGWAVADDQTYAWRLQTLRPDLRVLNHGVGGYGTTQALLLLDELLAAGQRPARVLYGDIGHERRNVAAPGWLLALRSNTAARATPYATLGPHGALSLHPPEAYPAVPMDERLAVAALLEDALARFRPYAGAGDPRRITELLIAEMAERGRRAGVPFSLVLLSLGDDDHAARLAFARAHGIDVIDCNLRLTPDLAVPGEGHPNAAAHGRWGDCIAAALAEPDRLPVEPPGGSRGGG